MIDIMDNEKAISIKMSHIHDVELIPLDIFFFFFRKRPFELIHQS